MYTPPSLLLQASQRCREGSRSMQLGPRRDLQDLPFLQHALPAFLIIHHRGIWAAEAAGPFLAGNNFELSQCRVDIL